MTVLELIQAIEEKKSEVETDKRNHEVDEMQAELYLMQYPDVDQTPF